MPPGLEDRAGNRVEVCLEARQHLARRVRRAKARQELPVQRLDLPRQEQPIVRPETVSVRLETFRVVRGGFVGAG